MGNSFLNVIAQKVVEAYIARNTARDPVAPQPIPIQALIVIPEQPAVTIHPNSPLNREEGVFVSLPVTPPNERVTEMDFKQAAELDEINQRSIQPEPVPVESVDAIYNRYLMQFPILPELSPREASLQSEQGEQALESVSITPPPTPATPSSPEQSDTFVVVDLSR